MVVPEHADLKRELNEVPQRGLPKLPYLPLPALSEAARIVGDDPTAEWSGLGSAPAPGPAVPASR